jgi:hypothetical protein
MSEYENLTKMSIVRNVMAMSLTAYNLALDYRVLMEKSMEELQELQDDIIADYNKVGKDGLSGVAKEVHSTRRT